MAVQILNNDLPDAKIHRADPRTFACPALRAPQAAAIRNSGRAGILVLVIALHVIGALILTNLRRPVARIDETDPILATIVDAPAAAQESPPTYVPPQNISYALPMPESVDFEIDAVVAPESSPASASSSTPAQALPPPLVESVEYVRAVPPVYPRESQRRREYGTVLVRVLVDERGRPADVRIERSSGHERLDSAALDAVRKFLFHPYEVNGVAQAAQVLIPIGFDRHSS